MQTTMKINNIIAWSAAIATALSLFSCAEDKYYDIGGEKHNRVEFKAINLAIGEIDEAESTTKEYYYLEEIDKKFPLTIYIPWDIVDGEMRSEQTYINIYKESSIWTGGYSDIQITFTPSAPEEKSATFTMPDGTTHTATSDNPTFIWTPDSTFRNAHNSLYDKDIYIKAESNYKKGNTTYENEGYIYVQLDGYSRYNKDTDKWYYISWMYGGSLTLPSYNRFTVDVVGTTRTEDCISYNSMFPQSGKPKEGTFSLFLMNPYDNTSGFFDSTLPSNEFIAGEDAIVMFLFKPQNGETSMRLNLPPDRTVTLTAENPDFQWIVDGNEVGHYAHDITITGTSSYIKDGITYLAESSVIMKYDPTFRFVRLHGGFILN